MLIMIGLLIENQVGDALFHLVRKRNPKVVLKYYRKDKQPSSTSRAEVLVLYRLARKAGKCVFISLRAWLDT